MRWPVVAEFNYKKVDKKGNVLVNSSGKIRARKFSFNIRVCTEHGEVRKNPIDVKEKCFGFLWIDSESGRKSWKPCDKPIIDKQKSMVCYYAPCQQSIDVPDILSRFTVGNRFRVVPSKFRGPAYVNAYALTIADVIRNLDYWNAVSLASPERIKETADKGEVFEIKVNQITEEEMDAYVHQFEKEQIIKKI
jgi:hypothetical protein